MKTPRHRLVSVTLLWLGLWSAAAPWAGRAAVFTVDSSRSQLSLAGNVIAYGVNVGPILAQGPGSLTTSFVGGLNADLTGASVQLSGSSAVAGQNNGTWQPGAGGNAGSALADYGAYGQTTIIFVGTVTAYAALRGVVFDVTSAPLSLSNGSFDSHGLVFSFVTNANGTIDYRDTFGDAGTFPLAGSATNNASSAGSLSSTGSVQTLVLPVDFTYLVTAANGSGSLAGTTLHMTGQIVATRSVASPLITRLAVTNSTALVWATNATLQSQLWTSSNLKNWSLASPTVSSAGGQVLFSTPVSGAAAFYRVAN